MLNPHDRRDLACLGLMVLVYGLAVAPVLHAVVGHGEGHAGVARRHTHTHGPGSEAHSHGPGWDSRSNHGSEARALAARDDGASGKARATGAGAEDSRSRRDSGRGAPEHREPGDGHGPDGHQHLTGSVEHLHAMAAAWAVVTPPRVRAVSWLAEVVRGPSRAPGSAPRLTAMPQGP